MNKYNKLLLSNYGCEIVEGNGIQGIKEISKDGNKLDRLDYTAYGDCRNYSEAPNYRLDLVKSSKYKDDNSAIIVQEENEKMTVVVNPNLSIVSKYYRNDKSVKVVLVSLCPYNKKQSTEVYKVLKVILTPYELVIETELGKVVTISPRMTDCIFNSEKINIENCTHGILMDKIDSKLINYDHGTYLNESLKNGLNIIRPIIEECVDDLIRNWLDSINKTIVQEQQIQYLKESHIRKEQHDLMMSRLYVNLLKEVGTNLQLEVGKPKIR